MSPGRGCRLQEPPRVPLGQRQGGKKVLLGGDIKANQELGGSPCPDSCPGSSQKAVSSRSKASPGQSSSSTTPPFFVLHQPPESLPVVQMPSQGSCWDSAIPAQRWLGLWAELEIWRLRLI